MDEAKVGASLLGVPETMLWTLQNRAVEAMRSDGIIDDPKAVEIFNSIAYDYEKSFGKAEPSHAVRSLDFDREVSRFLAQYPKGTIVNLGEGLETQRFRFKDNEALWVSVDLPDAITAREQYIQPDEQHIHLAISALDLSWFDGIPHDQPTLVTAQGLLMYFSEAEVRTLLQAITARFETVCIVFDTIPKWLSKKTLSAKGWHKTSNYKTPRMPWGINRNTIKPTLARWLSYKVIVTDIGYSDFPRGVAKWLFKLAYTTPVFKYYTPSIIRVSSLSFVDGG